LTFSDFFKTQGQEPIIALSRDTQGLARGARGAGGSHMTRLKVSSTVLASLAIGLFVPACGVETSDEALQEEQQGIRNGSPLDRVERPYEKLMMYVSGCGGLLLGNSTGSAKYVLTARHCTDNGLPDVHFPSGDIPGGGAKRVLQHPLALAGGVDTVDVALVELNSSVTTNSRVYFSSLTPGEMIGLQARCYGAGNIADYGINTGVFTLTADTLNPQIHYDVALPNELGQYISSGDSGGACVRTTGTQDVTIFGINKSGDRYTFARQTAAVAFSDWVRSYVPR
jgi:hypothetical protein